MNPPWKGVQKKKRVKASALSIYVWFETIINPKKWLLKHFPHRKNKVIFKYKYILYHICSHITNWILWWYWKLIAWKTHWRSKCVILRYLISLRAFDLSIHTDAHNAHLNEKGFFPFFFPVNVYHISSFYRCTEGQIQHAMNLTLLQWPFFLLKFMHSHLTMSIKVKQKLCDDLLFFICRFAMGLVYITIYAYI